MMPTVKGMSHMIPTHVLRVGQTICLEPAQETVIHCTSLPKSHHDDPDLDISLENLNQLILELDPTFEPIQNNKSPTCISPPTGTVRLNLSLTGEDLDPPDSVMSGSCSDDSRMKSCNNRQSLEKPLITKRGHLQEANSRRAQNCRALVSGSLTDIPLLLVNGAPQPDLHWPEPEIELLQSVPLPKPACSGFQARFNGSQPSMKFVMDTSKFWFRPHITEALLKDKEAGTFVVRDSTSYRGSFGLAMKVDQTPASFTAAAYPGESSSDLIRHFLIESSAKGVRIKGSSQEPYFGSLSALVYQHTISAYALPCRLRLYCHGNQAFVITAHFSVCLSLLHTSNFIYLDAVPTEMLTGPCAVQKAVSSTLEKAPGSFTPTIVNMKVSLKGVTLTDINRKLFFRRHYPAHLLSYSSEDPDNRVLFGFVAKGIEAGMENVCHVFAEYDSLQACNKVIEVIQAAIAKCLTTERVCV
uniref:Tensin 4 n=1 Tax=Amphilophus citrinellus TaxID=61819 RepID=A0A3Q0T4V0_AMPCI